MDVPQRGCCAHAHVAQPPSAVPAFLVPSLPAIGDLRQELADGFNNFVNPSINRGSAPLVDI
jgi:hypothetical protein